MTYHTPNCRHSSTNQVALKPRPAIPDGTNGVQIGQTKGRDGVFRPHLFRFTGRTMLDKHGREVPFGNEEWIQAWLLKTSQNWYGANSRYGKPELMDFSFALFNWEWICTQWKCRADLMVWEADADADITNLGDLEEIDCIAWRGRHKPSYQQFIAIRLDSAVYEGYLDKEYRLAMSKDGKQLKTKGWSKYQWILHVHIPEYLEQLGIKVTPVSHPLEYKGNATPALIPNPTHPAFDLYTASDRSLGDSDSLFELSHEDHKGPLDILNPIGDYQDWIDAKYSGYINPPKIRPSQIWQALVCNPELTEKDIEKAFNSRMKRQRKAAHRKHQNLRNNKLSQAKAKAMRTYARRAYQDGCTVEYIAEIMGKHERTIRNYLSLTEDEKRDVILMTANDVSPEEIAKEMKLPVEVVTDYLSSVSPSLVEKQKEMLGLEKPCTVNSYPSLQTKQRVHKKESVYSENPRSIKTNSDPPPGSVRAYLMDLGETARLESIQRDAWRTAMTRSMVSNEAPPGLGESAEMKDWYRDMKRKERREEELRRNGKVVIR